MAFKFREPLLIQQSTGVLIDPNNRELFGLDSPSLTTTISIGQAVATDSNLVLDSITSSS